MWLRALFYVRDASGRDTVWVIDFLRRTLVEITGSLRGADALRAADAALGEGAPQGTRSWAYTALHRIDRSPDAPLRLSVRFYKERGPHDLHFSSPQQRGRFYELAIALGRGVLWCPALSPPYGPPQTTVYLTGEFESAPVCGSPWPAVRQKLAHCRARFRISREPTDSLRLWVGSCDLRQQVLPDDVDLRAWLCPGRADLYVIGVVNVPPAYQGGLGSGPLDKLFKQQLGEQQYAPLLSTDLEPGRRSSALMVLVSRSRARGVSCPGAWTGSTRRYTSVGTERAEEVAADAVALSFRYNETSLGFVCTQLVQHDSDGLEGDDRAQLLEDILSRVDIGTPTADLSCRFDHLWLMGGLGAGVLHGSDSAAAPDAFASFSEGVARLPPQSPGDFSASQRVLWRSREGTQLASPDYEALCPHGGAAEGRVAARALFDFPTQLQWCEALSPPQPRFRVVVDGCALICTHDDAVQRRGSAHGDAAEGAAAGASAEGDEASPADAAAPPRPPAAPGGAWRVGAELLRSPHAVLWADWGGGTRRAPMPPSPAGLPTASFDAIEPDTHAREWLRRQIVVLTVREGPGTQGDSALCGSGALSLGDAVDSLPDRGVPTVDTAGDVRADVGEAVTFAVPLMRHCRPTGAVLTGSLRVETDADTMREAAQERVERDGEARHRQAQLESQGRQRLDAEERAALASVARAENAARLAISRQLGWREQCRRELQQMRRAEAAAREQQERQEEAARRGAQREEEASRVRALASERARTAAAQGRADVQDAEARGRSRCAQAEQTAWGRLAAEHAAGTEEAMQAADRREQTQAAAGALSEVERLAREQLADAEAAQRRDATREAAAARSAALRAAARREAFTEAAAAVASRESAARGELCGDEAAAWGGLVEGAAAAREYARMSAAQRAAVQRISARVGPAEEQVRTAVAAAEQSARGDLERRHAAEGRAAAAAAAGRLGQELGAAEAGARAAAQEAEAAARASIAQEAAEAAGAASSRQQQRERLELAARGRVEAAEQEGRGAAARAEEAARESLAGAAGRAAAAAEGAVRRREHAQGEARAEAEWREEAQRRRFMQEEELQRQQAAAAAHDDAGAARRRGLEREEAAWRDALSEAAAEELRGCAEAAALGGGEALSRQRAREGREMREREALGCQEQGPREALATDEFAVRLRLYSVASAAEECVLRGAAEEAEAQRRREFARGAADAAEAARSRQTDRELREAQERLERACDALAHAEHLARGDEARGEAGERARLVLLSGEDAAAALRLQLRREAQERAARAMQEAEGRAREEERAAERAERAELAGAAAAEGLAATECAEERERLVLWEQSAEGFTMLRVQLEWGAVAAEAAAARRSTAGEYRVHLAELWHAERASLLEAAYADEDAARGSEEAAEAAAWRRLQGLAEASQDRCDEIAAQRGPVWWEGDGDPLPPVDAAGPLQRRGRGRWAAWERVHAELRGGVLTLFRPLATVDLRMGSAAGPLPYGDPHGVCFTASARRGGRVHDDAEALMAPSHQDRERWVAALTGEPQRVGTEVQTQATGDPLRDPRLLAGLDAARQHAAADAARRQQAALAALIPELQETRESEDKRIAELRARAEELARAARGSEDLVLQELRARQGAADRTGGAEARELSLRLADAQAQVGALRAALRHGALAEDAELPARLLHLADAQGEEARAAALDEAAGAAGLAAAARRAAALLEAASAPPASPTAAQAAALELRAALENWCPRAAAPLQSRSASPHTQPSLSSSPPPSPRTPAGLQARVLELEAQLAELREIASLAAGLEDDAARADALEGQLAASRRECAALRRALALPSPAPQPEGPSGPTRGGACVSPERPRRYYRGASVPVPSLGDADGLDDLLAAWHGAFVAAADDAAAASLREAAAALRGTRSLRDAALVEVAEAQRAASDALAAQKERLAHAVRTSRLPPAPPPPPPPPVALLPPDHADIGQRHMSALSSVATTALQPPAAAPESVAARSASSGLAAVEAAESAGRAATAEGADAALAAIAACEAAGRSAARELASLRHRVRAPSDAASPPQQSACIAPQRQPPLAVSGSAPRTPGTAEALRRWRAQHVSPGLALSPPPPPRPQVRTAVSWRSSSPPCGAAIGRGVSPARRVAPPGLGRLAT
eukprot:TRINITY_DN1642_c0_g1_i2.p1 TRINITY_DN1642_c0_g1~~TRINITY_DN1642_c0_g1_i2.p1  ORF type:complete len:2245 (+),score=494.03 TRINITY_DN1642_c0_g1_i2:291-6737(+)